MRTELSKCAMGVSSKSAIVPELTGRSFAGAHPNSWSATESRPPEHELIPKTFVSDDVCLYGMKKAREFFKLGKKESPSHVGTYTITIKVKAENPDSKASPFCAIKNLAPI